jgi:Kdo2-lipid IVA lauroyltransferase/acyltransferase
MGRKIIFSFFGLLNTWLAYVILWPLRGVFALARLLGLERASTFGGWLLRHVGPLLPSHVTALGNVRAAFPEKTEEQVQAIVRAAWDNLGRTSAEYAHLDHLFDFEVEHPHTGRCQVEGIEHFLHMRDDGKPAIIFSAHLGNWELPAICAAKYGLEATAVYRPPNTPAVARLVEEVRRETMGGLAASGQGAAFALQGVLERGGHLGMLMDQHFTRGVVVTFFGQPVLANPILAKFARHFDCPVHGVRVIRKPHLHFELKLTPPLDLPRDAQGLVDVQQATQMMTAMIEDWVREHPEQWLWMHRRWRPQLVEQVLKKLEMKQAAMPKKNA